MENLLIKNIQPFFKTFKNKSHIKIIMPILIFLTLNTLKITLFNLYIIGRNSYVEFAYKYIFTLILAIAIYIFILKLKSPLFFVSFYIIQTAYIFANLAYYLYFHNYLHIFQIATLFSEGMDAAGHFAIPRNAKLLVILIDFPAFIYMLLRYSKVAAITSKLRFYRVVAVLLCITTITIGEGWNYIHNYSLIQFTSNYSDSENSIVERYGTLANSIVDFSTNSGDKKLISNLKYGETISTSNNIHEKPNFIVIQVESMDASVINEKHNGEYVAPFLHSLSQNSIYYPYTLSYHKAGGTSDCEFSIIDSVEPLDNYPAIKIKNYNYPNSMVERLAAQAYSTTAIHGNIASYFNRDTAYPKMGFQEFDDMTKMGLKDVGWGAPDNKVFDYAENKLKTQTGPFFDYIITMTSHGPFTNANYYYHNNNYDDIKDTVVKDYLNSMSYVDKSIGDFVSYVQANLKNTYVLIWGDHTPSISNDIYRQASFIQDNKYFEFVPLMIISPDHRVYKEDKKVASFLDVAPTILNASGIPYEIKTNGENLLDTAALDRDIPFKGSNYSRQSLFDKISSLNN